MYIKLLFAVLLSIITASLSRKSKRFIRVEIPTYPEIPKTSSTPCNLSNPRNDIPTA